MLATRHAIKSHTRLVGQARPLTPIVRWTPQQRHVWNSGIKRTVTLAAMGSVGLLGMVILGPFILVGIGGLGAVLAFRFWRFKKQFESGMKNDFPGFMQQVFEKQQMLGKEKRQVEGEALSKFKQWIETEQGRRWMIEHGMHPDRILENVSMRATSFTLNQSKTIKIELDLGQSGSVLMAVAEIVEGNVSLTSVNLMTVTGDRMSIPLQQYGGRVIEGEFRDVQ